MAKALPHRLYAKREKDGDTEYFIASEDFEDLGAIGEVIEIGVYSLADTKELDSRPRILK